MDREVQGIFVPIGVVLEIICMDEVVNRNFHKGEDIVQKLFRGREHLETFDQPGDIPQTILRLTKVYIRER